MEKKDFSLNDLSEKIKALELQEALEIVEFKKKVQEFKDNVTPASLVASAYTGFKQNKTVQGSILDSTAGLAAGWLIRKLLTPKSGSVIKMVGGYLLQYAATKFITKTIPVIRDKVHINRFRKS